MGPPTLSQWCAAVAGLTNRTDESHPAEVFKYAADLKRVNSAAVAADVRALLPLVARLLRQIGCPNLRKASMLDALGTSLQAHPPLLAAVAADAELCALLDGSLELAAEDGETYTNALCASQMATAQDKLGRFCVSFWRGLEQHGAQHLGARQLATVIHRAAALRESDTYVAASPAGVLQPGQGVCRALSDALLRSSKVLQAQAVANVLIAFPKLGWQLDGPLRDGLLLAARRESVRMVPQAVSNTLWALATLQLQPSAELQRALLGRALRLSASMTAQSVANIMWALATLRVQPDAELHAALLGRALQLHTDMNEQNVANTLWALAALQVQPGAELQAALLDRAWHVSTNMSEQGVANTLWALAALQVQPGAELQAALLDRAWHVSTSMTEQGVANTLWALAALQVQPGAELQAALLDPRMACEHEHD